MRMLFRRIALGLALTLALVPLESVRAYAKAEGAKTVIIEDTQADVPAVASAGAPAYQEPDVPACEAVQDAHFAGAVLVGDSLSDGLAIHQVVPELTVMSRIGLSPRTARTNDSFRLDDKPATLLEKLPTMRASAIYLWLGSNGLDSASMSVEDNIDAYDRLLRNLLSSLVDTPVCLLEVTPVRPLTNERHQDFTNEKIDAFNVALRALCVRHGIYLLPINALLRDETGYLEEDLAASDGIHLLKEAYERIGAYLYTHALPLP